MILRRQKRACIVWTHHIARQRGPDSGRAQRLTPARDRRSAAGKSHIGGRSQYGNLGIALVRKSDATSMVCVRLRSPHLMVAAAALRMRQVHKNTVSTLALRMNLVALRDLGDRILLSSTFLHVVADITALSMTSYIHAPPGEIRHAYPLRV
jgi:hypothetical protein